MTVKDDPRDDPDYILALIKRLIERLVSTASVKSANHAHAEGYKKGYAEGLAKGRKEGKEMLDTPNPPAPKMGTEAFRPPKGEVGKGHADKAPRGSSISRGAIGVETLGPIDPSAYD